MEALNFSGGRLDRLEKRVSRSQFVKVEQAFCPSSSDRGTGVQAVIAQQLSSPAAPGTVLGATPLGGHGYFPLGEIGEGKLAAEVLLRNLPARRAGYPRCDQK